MKEYVIFTDSSADFDAKKVEDLELGVLPLTITIEGKTYANWPDEREISFKDFYAQLRAGSSAFTSQVNVSEFVEAFRPILKTGKDILYLGFSSALSGTFNSGRLAAEELAEEFPDSKVVVVDTLAASLGQGLLVMHAVKMKNQGKTIDEVASWVEKNKLNLAHWFTVDDLNFLKRGGRLSGAAAFFGTVLNIKPILHVDNNGRLTAMEKVRGRKQSLLALAGHIKTSGIKPSEQIIYISHGDCAEDAQFLADEIKTSYNVKEIYINFVGPVIGSHSGPGTMALFFLATER